MAASRSRARFSLRKTLTLTVCRASEFICCTAGKNHSLTHSLSANSSHRRRPIMRMRTPSRHSVSLCVKCCHKFLSSLFCDRRRRHKWLHTRRAAIYSIELATSHFDTHGSARPASLYNVNSKYRDESSVLMATTFMFSRTPNRLSRGFAS